MTQTVDAPARATPLAPGARQDLARQLRFPLGIYAASRVVSIAAVLVLRALSPGPSLGSLLTVWDGHWYLRIIEHGYPSRIPEVGGVADLSEIPFFPLYPAIARGVSTLTGLGAPASAVGVSLVFGAVATVLVWITTRELFDRATADRAAAIFAFHPGAWVLSFAYAEAVMLTLTLAALLALHRGRWLAAGALGMLATATRPNAILLFPAAVWAAAVAIRRRREWRALLAPILTPIGAVAFLVYLGIHTGEADAWFRVQRQGWGEHVDWGMTSAHELRVLFMHPLQEPNDTIAGLTIVLALVLVVALVQARLPAIYTIFALGVLLLTFTSAVTFPRPRFVFAAFPLTIAAAAQVRGRALPLVLGIAGSCFALLSAWYAWTWGLADVLPP